MAVHYSTDAVKPLTERILSIVRSKEGGSTKKKTVIAVAGVPGAGKTTLVSRLHEHLHSDGISTQVLPQDGFHYYRSELAQFDDPEEAFRRRGAPFTFDAARFVATVRKLHGDGPVLAPLFDHAVKDPVQDDITIDADTDVVLVEGNYVGLADEPWCQLEALVDELWLVQTSPDLVRERIVRRHLATGVAALEKEAIERADGSDWQNALYIMSHTRDPDVLIS